MKKKLFAIALVAMSLVSVNVMAQKNKSDNGNKSNTECKVKNNCKKGDFKRVCPFDGLQLTDAQKQQLKQIDEKHRTARTEKSKALKAEKQRGDSARREARRADKRAYLKEVKEVIGPDQYVVFLENYYVDGGFQKIKGQKPRKHHDKQGKADKRDRKGGDRHHGSKGGGKTQTDKN